MSGVCLKTVLYLQGNQNAMMQPKIHMKRIGYSNSTLIVNGKNSILIDTGVKGFLGKILMMLKENRIKPHDVCLIILTHVHYDHTGNLHELKQLTGAKVLVHKNEYENLKKGYMPIPGGQRFLVKIVSGLGRMLIPGFASPKPFTADLVNNNEFSLEQYGINGKVISTPGHSPGSQSVIVGGKIIAGDCFMNMNYGVVFPHFAENPKLLLQSWENIFKYGVKDIYPGHGKILKSDKAYSVFLKWKKKLKVE
jgi:hydroxyacylglutathione hydrolase